MAKNAHTLHVRLSPDLIKKFENFHRSNFGGLPASLIARILITELLERPEGELSAIVLKHIQGRAPHSKPGVNRIGSDATKK